MGEDGYVKSFRFVLENNPAGCGLPNMCPASYSDISVQVRKYWHALTSHW